MKKMLILTIAAFLTIAIVKTSQAYHAIANCRATEYYNQADAMSGNFGLVYGTVSAVASVNHYDVDVQKFFTNEASVSVDDMVHSTFRVSQTLMFLVTMNLRGNRKP